MSSLRRPLGQRSSWSCLGAATACTRTMRPSRSSSSPACCQRSRRTRPRSYRMPAFDSFCTSSTVRWALGPGAGAGVQGCQSVSPVGAVSVLTVNEPGRPACPRGARVPRRLGLAGGGTLSKLEEVGEPRHLRRAWASSSQSALQRVSAEMRENIAQKNCLS